MQPADSKAILILRKDGAQITALRAGNRPPEMPPPCSSRVLDVQRNDASTSWQISEPDRRSPPLRRHRRLGGRPCAAEQFVATFGVVEVGRSALVTVSGTDTAWSTLKDEIVTIVSSLELGEAGS